MEMGDDQEVPLLPEELLAIEGFLEGDPTFFFKGIALGKVARLQKCPNSQEYTGKTNWINGLKQKRKGCNIG